MKTKLSLVVLFLLVYSCTSYSQQYSFGPKLNNYRTSLYKVGSTGTPTSRGLLSENQMTEVGKSSGTLYRALYQWNIPDEVIPDNSTIDSVRITYMYSKVHSSTNLSAFFYRIPADISISNPNWPEIWGMFIYENKIAENENLATNKLGSIPNPPGMNYDDMPKLIDAVKKSLSGNKFVLGIMSSAENNSEERYFYVSTGFVEIRIYFKRPHQSVTVTQVLSTGAGYGNVGRYEGNNFIDRITGTTYSLEVGSTEYFRADTSKATVADEKFNFWNTAGNVINHNGFPIDSTTSSIVSHFNQIGTATVKNALEGLSSVTADIVNFKDPWLRDDGTDYRGLRNRGSGAIWQPHASPFVQDINHPRYKGVLLNQTRSTQNFYSVLAPYSFDKYLSQTGKTHRFQFVDWTATNATVSYPMVTETPVIFTANNAEVKANYKASMLSGTQSAFSNSSQRKFIRTPNDGYYHIVYESMGKIWYERSTDGGTTWTLQNGGKPLNTDKVFIPGGGGVSGSGSYTTAKHPAIDYYQDKILIVWQEQSGSNYVVRLAFLRSDTLVAKANELPFQSYGLYSEDVYPEIAVKDNGFAVIALRRNDNLLKGLEVHYITLVNAALGRATDYCSAKIPGTDQNTGLFTLAADKNGSDKFHIAWQQNGTSSSSMMYSKFIFSWLQGELPNEGSYAMNIVENLNITNSTGYTQSFSPSMIGATDGTARLSFKGYRQYYPGSGSYSIATTNPDNLSWIPYLNKYSGEVFSPQISQGTETYFVGWTELTGGVYRTIVTDASTLRNMETVSGSLGRDMQINPGGARSQQFSMSFNSEATALPYFFTRSSEAIGMIVAKKLAIKTGRGIFLTKDESQMYFILGNVTSEGVPIDFIESQDTVRLDGSLKKVNSFMTTKPFSLKDNSTLSFAVIYGTKDSAASESGIKEGQFASFKVDLVDDATGRVIGSYMDEKMDKTNIYGQKEGVYKISSDGIGNKLVRLRVSVDENMKSQYTISDMFFGEGLPLSKSLKEKEMGLEGSMEVKEYALSQNYPNPFNPTTMISYALPRASKVSLKVYDILGKEVATLVNGYMEIGKYSVEFNASALPSGIYIYEIRANDFVKSGKMMLLK